MKTILILFLALFVQVAFAQTTSNSVGIDINDVEVAPPSFIGNTGTYQPAQSPSKKISEYLAQKSADLDEALQYGMEGTQVVRFNITSSGNIEDIQVINSVSSLIDKEVVNALKKTDGMWNPGHRNGVATSMEQEISLFFSTLPTAMIAENFRTKATKLFVSGGKYMFEQQNLKKALRAYNQGIKYLPHDKGLLMMRGICLYEMGKTSEAIKDWNRIVQLGGLGIFDISNQDEIAELTAYDAMQNILAK